MKYLKNKKGMTLIELTAAIVILAIIIISISSILSTTTREQVKLSSANQNIKEVSYASKVITKDFRKGTSFDSTTMTLNYSTEQNGARKVIYYLNNKEITRSLIDINETPISSSIIASDISKLLICKEPIDTTSTSCPNISPSDNTYYVYILSNTGQSVQTEITIR